MEKDHNSARANTKHWLEEWALKRKNKPWRLILEVGKIAAGENIAAVAVPDAYQRKQLAQDQSGTCEKDYEIPVAIIAETLTEANAPGLESTLRALQKVQGLPFEEGLAFLTQQYLFALERARYEAGMNSILEGPTYGDLPEKIDRERLIDDVMLKPIGSVMALLHVWQLCQGNTISGFAKPMDNKIGRPTYRYLPPRWLTLEDIDRLYPGDEQGRTVPIAVNAAIVGHAEPFRATAAFIGQMQGLQKTNTPRYLFKSGVDTWEIIYDGMPVSPPLKNSKGLHYIAFLLSQPGREHYTLEIIHRVDGTPYEPDETHSAMSAEELDEHGLRVSGFTDTGPIMDNKYKAHVEKEMKELEEKLDRAKAMGDPQAVDKAESDLRHYRRALSEGIGRGGRHRVSGNPHEKARVKVTLAINRVLNKLREQHSPLFEHLHSSIRTGIKCSYNPSTPIDWNTEK